MRGIPARGPDGYPNPEYQRAYYAANRDRIRARQKRSYDKGPRRMDQLAYRTIAVNLLIQRDGHLCSLCDKAIRPGEESIDHIVMRSHGGTHNAQNLRLVHLDCNNRRRRRKPRSACAVDGCERQSIVRGWCNMHYRRWLKGKL